MSAQQTTYELIGGAEKLRELVDRFYDLMDLEEGYQGIRVMHPADLSTSREKLYMFLSGWMSGSDSSTRGPNWTDRWCICCSARSTAE